MPARKAITKKTSTKLAQKGKKPKNATKSKSRSFSKQSMKYINPKTGREIKYNGPTYQKLVADGRVIVHQETKSSHSSSASYFVNGKSVNRETYQKAHPSCKIFPIGSILKHL